MREFAKNILRKLHLFEPAKRVVYAKRRGAAKSRAEKVLSEETLYAFDCFSSVDSTIARLKIRVHSIEKSIVKEKYNAKTLAASCVSVLADTAALLDGGYPAESDIAREAAGIARLFVQSEKNEHGQAVSKKLDTFTAKYGIQSSSFHNISIEKADASFLSFIDSAQYDKFVRTRHSLRNLAKRHVDYETVRDIVQTALVCPSACNRQSMKVYYIEDSEALRPLFPDPFVSRDIYNLLVVTVNKAYFSTGEVLQAWIDAGIFIESLCMAIHSRGLGSCIFQCIKGTANSLKVKEALSIPKNEDIAAYIGYGYLPDSFNYISSHRREVEECLIARKITGNTVTMGGGILTTVVLRPRHETRSSCRILRLSKGRGAPRAVRVGRVRLRDCA